MSKNEIIKRYLLFIVSLFFAALGVAFAKHGELGVSPISSVANVMNCRFDMISLGTWLIIWNCVLLLGQIVILRKKFQPIQMLQLPLSFLFGWFTDLCMWMVAFLPNDSYPLRLLMVFIGIIILGFGISLSVIANVIMNSGEAFVKAIADTIHKEFSNVKIVFDIFCVIIALALSLVFFDFTIVGTREGTIASALLTGISVKLWTTKLKSPLEKILSPAYEVESNTENYDESDNFVITISREYGSGGRNIGNLIANKLGVKCYDEEIIRMAAEKNGLDFEFTESNEEKISHIHLYDFYEWYSPEAKEYNLNDLRKIKNAEEQVIRELYDRESCVIVGRQANSILQKHKNVINIFISADREDKINRIIERDGLSKVNAGKKMDKVDKQRKNYGKEFYHMEWENCSNYDLSFNASKISAEIIADAVIELKEKMN